MSALIGMIKEKIKGTEKWVKVLSDYIDNPEEVYDDDLLTIYKSMLAVQEIVEVAAHVTSAYNAPDEEDDF